MYSITNSKLHLLHQPGSVLGGYLLTSGAIKGHASPEIHWGGIFFTASNFFWSHAWAKSISQHPEYEYSDMCALW